MHAKGDIMSCAAYHFRTQITRTMAAFASEDLPSLLTPLPVRNARTVSAETRIACADGVVLAGPATTDCFNSAMPANLPFASRAAAPEKPDIGGGASGLSLLSVAAAC